ncbi:MAG: hypothetical protein H7A47_03275 [Verrucomicrobiales bacterium]|nr:hypothetical protein [Verrucomicrobiales bacterium]
MQPSSQWRSLLAVGWFNPLLWLAFIRACEARCRELLARLDYSPDKAIFDALRQVWQFHLDSKEVLERAVKNRARFYREQCRSLDQLILAMRTAVGGLRRRAAAPGGDGGWETPLCHPAGQCLDQARQSRRALHPRAVARSGGRMARGRRIQALTAPRNP